MAQKVTLQDVRSFWEKYPAGYDELQHLEGDPLAFLEESDRRTRLVSPHIHTESASFRRRTPGHK